MKQTIIWTALPKGVSADGRSLLLTVLVSPRLDTGGPPLPLADFPAFADWPSQSLRISVRFNNLAPVPATITSPAGESALWTALFPGSETLVRSFVAADHAQERIHSFPVTNVVGHLRKLYATVGLTSPTELPDLPTLEQAGATAIRTVEGKGREWLDLTRQREATLLSRFRELETTALPPAPPEPDMDFFRASYFHRFRGGKLDDPVKPPEFDFHDALAMLRNHPLLMRRLGLALEVSVPFTRQPPTGTVQVAAVAHAFVSEDQPVRVRYELNAKGRRFNIAPRNGSDLQGGMLRLDTASFSLQQVDVDGAALKAVDFANQLHMRARERLRAPDSPKDDGLPALRTGGISVVRNGRATRLSETLKTVAQINASLGAPNPPDLFADDLTQGFRLDVLDAGGVWRSLCERDVFYHVGRRNGPGARFSAQDEGVVTAAAMQDVDPGRNDFFLHEAMFHWDGWSLVAPRPGETVLTDGLSHGEALDANGGTRNPSATSLELEISTTVRPRSLPRLRFGATYRLRARAVDVAGHSLPLTDPGDNQASPPITYRRFEPVEPPTVAMISTVPPAQLAGESTMRLVIRSYNDSPAEDGIPSPEVSERLLLPPRSSVAMVEQYGHLDMPAGVDASADTWNRLATLDAANLPEVFDDPDTLPLDVPYLPDPFCEAAVFRGLPGAPADTAQAIAFDAAPGWWQGKPFRLALLEGNAPPTWDTASRTLTVELPKAAVVKLKLSSRLTPADLDKMAIWKWIEEEAFDDEQRHRMRQLALAGLHWMITPFRELTLVHAVQQPLAPPEILSLFPRKLQLGDTYASLDGVVRIHAPSTGKVDLLARWSEPTGFGFTRREGQSHAFEVPVMDAGLAQLPWGRRRHEFGDTRYRKVAYHAIATTRFREYFDPSLPTGMLTRPPVDARPPVSDAHVFVAEVLNSARPLAPSVLYIVPTFGWASGNDERGVFSRRSGGLRIYLEEPWFSSGDGELLGVMIWPGEPDRCTAGAPAKGARETLLVPDPAKPYATQWGQDPIWLAGATRQVPSPDNFTRSTAVQLGLRIAESSAMTLAVAGHPVGYDEARHLFYCDIDIDAGRAYFPFVRLALVRYQPKSIAGAEVSRIVVTDFAQFAPDRLCRVARDADGPRTIRVTVSGTGYRANASFQCASEIEARLERWLENGTECFDWVPVSTAPVTLVNAQALRDLSVWENTLTLPTTDPDVRFRVVVEEYEAFLGDVPTAERRDTFGSGRERRLVYCDAVEIG